MKSTKDRLKVQIGDPFLEENNLLNELNEVIDNHRGEGLSYAQMIGVLALVKATVEAEWLDGNYYE